MLVHALHGLLVEPRAGALIDRVVVLVEELHRCEIFGLARALGLRHLALLHGLPPGLENGQRERRHEWIGPLAHRQAPIRDGAVWILCDDRAESLDGLRK